MPGKGESGISEVAATFPVASACKRLAKSGAESKQIAWSWRSVTDSPTRDAPCAASPDITTPHPWSPTTRFIPSALYHVTAGTKTLAGPANRPPPFRAGAAYIGGAFFNLIGRSRPRGVV